jgi:hypothetical protein
LLPYWLLFAVFALGSLEYRRRGLSGATSNPILAAAAIAVMLMIGLRFEVGGDWATYIQFYDFVRVTGQAFVPGGDLAYTWVNWIGARLGVEIWFVNLVCAAVFVWGFWRFARQQPNPWLAFLIAVPYLIIVVAMGYTRQAVAIGLILAGLSVRNRISIVSFALLLLVAVAFHKTAVVVLPLVGLATSRNRLVTMLFFFMLTAVLFYFFLSSSLDKLVVNYIGADYDSQGAYIRIAMNVPPALLFLFFRKRFELSPDVEKLWTNFSIAALASVVFLIILPSSTAVDRLALYLIPLQAFVLGRLPYIFSDRQRANGQLVLAVIVYSALIQFVWLNYAVYSKWWLPYQFYPWAVESGADS